MESKIEKLLSQKIYKDELALFVNQNSDEFDNALILAMGDNANIAWRAAWLIKIAMIKNDKRIKPYSKKIIEAIKGKKDGHQRELLNILEKMDVNKENEGFLFDICITIWEDTHKISSVRIVAFRMIYNLVKKYPELINEIELIAQDFYAKDLSPGIKNSFFIMKKELQKLTLKK